MSRVLALMQAEPALAGGLVQAVLALLVAFGLDLTREQQGAIVGLSAVILAVAVGIRSQVSPVASLRVRPPAHTDPFWSPHGGEPDKKAR